jgi:Anti-sigma factor NepR
MLFSRKHHKNSEYGNVFNVSEGRGERRCVAIADAGSGVKLSMVEIPENQRRADMAGRAGARISDPNTQIASKLKALYSAIEQEPIPDTFLDLLEKLDRAEQLGKSRS